MNRIISSVYFFFEDVKEIRISKRLIRKWIQQLLKVEGATFSVINIIFCSDKYLLKINKEYLKKNEYTDIICFEYSDNEVLGTDMFISLERIRENSKKYAVDFNNELYRVIAHGILHICGYSDKTDSEQKIMRSKEDTYINMIKEL